MFNGDLEPADRALMVRVSRLYYEQGRTQEQIARATGLSRPTVSRTLDRAKRAGIVQIRILDPAAGSQALAHELASRFKLREVVLADAAPDGEASPRSRVGHKVGEYLRGLLRDGMTLGVTWGKTLQEMALALKPAHLADLTVVQMMGGLAVLEDSMETTRLAQEVGRILGGRTVQLLAPAFVSDPGPGGTSWPRRPSRQATDFLRRLDAAVVGIGAVSPHVSLVERGYLTAAEMVRYRRLGARGEMLLQFFDAERQTPRWTERAGDRDAARPAPARAAGRGRSERSSRQERGRPRRPSRTLRPRPDHGRRDGPAGPGARPMRRSRHRRSAAERRR